MNIFHHVYRASLKQNCKVIIIFFNAVYEVFNFGFIGEETHKSL